MNVVPRVCTICERYQKIGNYYGVPACCACKMFFKRAIADNEMTSHAIPTKSCRMQCRECRLFRCVEKGMFIIPESTFNVNNYDKLTSLLVNLEHMQVVRTNKLETMHIFTNPSIEEIAWNGRPKFEKRPKDMTMDVTEWSFMCGITAIDYALNFPHIAELAVYDRKLILRNCFFYLALLSDALRAVTNKQDSLSFPDGSDVIPPNTDEVSDELKKRIRITLVGRACELQITKEETYLLSTIIMSNPSVADISPAARKSLETNQQIYTSALFQLCQAKNGASGPSRFVDLLSLCHKLENTQACFGYLSMTCAQNRNPVCMKKLFDH
ncbi:Protein CBG15506 [Caenorhabditis briggsae]|uniref:Protein CBG15506 n=2 Tax=Caenorhabditis briggsae TaxID=6238 RepID=A8XM67_CAEBR|nr:Protein CBG15506 [Caenorhabditis briggsae]ULT83829.1 hypothetical protein L3Y34_012839 [Caenorhabditis briggsae]CAP33742.1 Protein CBG15506 [Caenorhabditis briggsae]